ncbi:hypothetical protein Trydic_g11527 [Trypoxylus dichotomus]
MIRLTLVTVVLVSSYATGTPMTGDELVGSVVRNCAEMGCVKSEVLRYLDSLLSIQSESARSMKNIDGAIYKRAARVLKTHEFRYKLPEIIFGETEMVYNPQRGLDFETSENENTGRGLLKKKLLFPALLLLKLKLKAIMPILLALVGLKAMKALILSKLAIAIVLGFVIYQLVTKSGMPMPMSMSPMPPEPPAPIYGAPLSSTPSSYEPGWEPSGNGPYARKNGKQEGFLNPIDKRDLPLETYDLDDVGLLQMTRKDYKYLLVIIDSFTKFVWIYPTKTVAIQEVVDKLSSLKQIFRNPKRIIVDTGSAFTSEQFRNYCNEEGIELAHITQEYREEKDKSNESAE